MQRTKLKAPFGWVGGKTQLAKDIINLIPDDHKTYIEVFGGAASVLYQKEPSKLEVLNDINSELINLHRAIRNNPQTLSMYLNDLFISREIFDDIKKSVIELIENNDIEQIVITTENIMSGFNKEIGFKIRK
jgi:DNA adenine methylase